MATEVSRDDVGTLGRALGLFNTDLTSDPPVEKAEEVTYNVVSDPKADQADLSELRGVPNEEKKLNATADNELENLAELVPDIKARAPEDKEDEAGHERKMSVLSGKADSTYARQLSEHSKESEEFAAQDYTLQAAESSKVEDESPARVIKSYDAEDYQAADEASSSSDRRRLDEYPDSIDEDVGEKVPKEFMNMSSSNSISTATQTHDVRMPMYLPNFKPATGCTNASDFIVRCFIARLRSGITVVKHGRSRWCKSRLRVLHIHPDGRSLSWKPAEGEPNSSKRPPKLDLSTCQEVRHAWSPDPNNPMYTGTTILRNKCEAANAHKSFALIFKQRTVDITAVTADQCKVLMEGFSALCFRLQVATLAGRGGKKGQAMPEEDGVSTTASNTLTNTSTPRR